MRVAPHGKREPPAARRVVAPGLKGSELEKKRVVITGMGAVTPLGNTRDEFWRRLIAGESGVARVTAFDAAAAGLKAQIAAEVKNFDPDASSAAATRAAWTASRNSPPSAAREAIEDAAFPEDRELRDETGVVVASGIGGIITIQDNVTKARAHGHGRPHHALLHSDADEQRGAGANFDEIRISRPDVRRLQRLREFERRVRRRLRHDRARQSPRHDHGRLGGDDHGRRHGRVRFDESAFDAQRRARAREPAVRSRSRRVRARRRRRDLRARGTRTRAFARRAHLRGAARVRRIRRRLRSGRGRSRGRRRRTGAATRVRVRRHRAERDRLRQRARARRRRSAIPRNRRRSAA